MTTATVPVEITCPEWCTDTAEHHASQLWDLGDTCIHHHEGFTVHDPTGYREPLEEPRYHRPVGIWFTTQTAPDGREVASPGLHIECPSEVTMAQAIVVAEAIQELVTAYRASGGIE